MEGEVGDCAESTSRKPYEYRENRVQGGLDGPQALHRPCKLKGTSGHWPPMTLAAPNSWPSAITFGAEGIIC